MNTIAEETFANVRTVKAFNTENREIQRFQEKNTEVLRLGKKKACCIGIFSLAMTIIIWFSFGGICYFAYILYTENKLSVGSILSYMEYMIVLMMTFGAVAGIIG